MTRANNAAALLVDADNLSAAGIGEALARLDADGLRVSVRRAYGSHETLAAVKELLQAASFRSIINQGKGTTDAALIVDAMDLLHAGCLPLLVAIGSADGDFAPLVLRLREAGMRVICFAKQQKAAENLNRCYDEVIYVDAPPVAAKSARKSPSPKAPAKPSLAPATEGDRVRQLLATFTGFSEGKEIGLNEVVKKLRDEKLMTKSTSARNYFKKHVPEVELRPDRQPNKLVMLVGKSRR